MNKSRVNMQLHVEKADSDCLLVSPFLELSLQIPKERHSKLPATSESSRVDHFNTSRVLFHNCRREQIFRALSIGTGTLA